MFTALKNIIVQIGITEIITYAVQVMLVLILYASLGYFVVRKTTKLKNVYVFLSVFFLFHLLIFQNPVFWMMSHKYLNAHDIGWRQKDELYVRSSEYYIDYPSKVLAVGNSQTNALYKEYASKFDDFSVISLAGMGTLDLYLYRNELLKKTDNYIILTISDFDLGRKPSIESMKLAPRQDLKSLFPFIRILEKTGTFTLREIIDFTVSQYIYIYKFNFLFKGYLELLSVNQKKADVLYNWQKNKELEEFRFNQLKNLNDKWFDLNLFFLNKFLSWSEKEHLQVIVVEGQYHPLAMIYNEKMHSEASAAIKKEIEMHSNAKYICIDSIMRFTESDYIDAYHVSLDRGYVFSSILFQKNPEIHGLKDHE